MTTDETPSIGSTGGSTPGQQPAYSEYPPLPSSGPQPGREGEASWQYPYSYPPPFQPFSLGRSLRQYLEPGNRPHPSFFAALLWCVVFLLCTQGPGAILAIVVFLFLMFLQPSMLPNEMGTTAEIIHSPAMNAALMVALGVSQILVSAFAIFALRLVVGKEWPRIVGLRLPKWWHLLLVLASFLPTVLLANVGFQLFKEYMPLPRVIQTISGMEEMVQIFNTWPWPLAVLIVGLGPGIGEELWCRAFLGRGLVGRYGVITGVIFTSFFFGLIHIDPVQGSMAMMMGLWLHFTYLATGSLLIPILLHFLNNSLAVVSSHFEILGPLDRSLEGFSRPLVITSVLVVSAVAYALYQSRVRGVIFPGLTAPTGSGGEYPDFENKSGNESYPSCPVDQQAPSWDLQYSYPSKSAVGMVVAAFLIYCLCFATVTGFRG